MRSRVPAGENGRDPAPPERRTGETVETSGRVVPRPEFPPRAGDGAQIPRRGARALPGITTSSTSSRIALQGKDTGLMLNRREGDPPQNLVRLPDSDSANTSPCNQNQNRGHGIAFVWSATEEGNKPLKYRANKGNGAKPPMESKNWGTNTGSELQRVRSALNPAELEREKGALDERRPKKKVAGQSRWGPNVTSKEMTEEKAEKAKPLRKAASRILAYPPLDAREKWKKLDNLGNSKAAYLARKRHDTLGTEKGKRRRGRTLHSKERMPTYLRSHSPIFFQQLPPLAGWISPPMYGEDSTSPTHESVCSRMDFPHAPSTTPAPDLVSQPTTPPNADPCDRRLPAPAAAPRSSIRSGELYRFATYSPGTAPPLNDDSILDPGLIDVDTGHEVRALPTRAHPDLPAAPRPGTPGPDRRLYEARPPRLAPNPKRVNSDVSMEDTPPRKTRRFKDKETKVRTLKNPRTTKINAKNAQSEYATLRKAARKAARVQAPVPNRALQGVLASLDEQEVAMDSESTNDDPHIAEGSEAKGPSRASQRGDKKIRQSGASQPSIEREDRALAVEAGEERAEVTHPINGSQGANPFPSQSTVPWGERAPRLPSVRHGALVDRERYSSSSNSSGEDSFPNQDLSPIFEGEGDDFLDFLAHLASPHLPPELDCRSPRPRSPTTARFAFNVSPLPPRSPSEDDIPPLSDISSDSDDGTSYEGVAGAYFTAVPTTFGVPGAVFPFYRAVGTPIPVDEAGLSSELAFIYNTPSPAVNPNERALDYVRMQGVSRRHDQEIAEMEDTEDAEVAIPLQHAVGIAARAVVFLDEAAMDREERVNIDTHQHHPEPEEQQLQEARRRAVDECLDVLTVKLGDGTRCFRDEYGVAMTPDGTHFRLLSGDAMMRQAMYRLALRILAMPRLTLIAFIADLRACVRAFIRGGAQLLKTRRWRYNLGNLRFRAHVPPPYLYGHEYAHLRLVYYAFVDHGHFDVAEAINAVLRLRFHEPAIIAHFLYGGLLDNGESDKVASGSGVYFSAN
ncbi:hypothetical protein C8R47DRAFT_1083132 [Mycena vitilis]|nr:hypothetical protein C8R47DRAFT_1083132 [Mycena vitilis]